MRKLLNKTHEVTDGKKTNFGMIIILAAQGARLLFPEFNPEFVNWVENVGYAIGAGGIAHKGVKWYQKKGNGSS